jgi:hypothetical protein
MCQNSVSLPIVNYEVTTNVQWRLLRTLVTSRRYVRHYVIRLLQYFLPSLVLNDDYLDPSKLGAKDLDTCKQIDSCCNVENVSYQLERLV